MAHLRSGHVEQELSLPTPEESVPRCPQTVNHRRRRHRIPGGQSVDSHAESWESADAWLQSHTKLPLLHTFPTQLATITTGSLPNLHESVSTINCLKKVSQRETPLPNKGTADVPVPQ